MHLIYRTENYARFLYFTLYLNIDLYVIDGSGRHINENFILLIKSKLLISHKNKYVKLLRIVPPPLLISLNKKKEMRVYIFISFERAIFN